VNVDTSSEVDTDNRGR